MKRSLTLALILAAPLLGVAGAAHARKPPPPAPLVAPPAAPGLPPAGSADWREVDPENTLVVDTNKGRIIAELAPEAAPNHVARIKELTRAHFYDGLTFFRVIDGFMDQTGDPNNTGEGNSDKPNLKAEFTFRRGGETPIATVAQPTGLELGFLKSLPVISQTSAMLGLTADGKVATWGAYCPGVLGAARSDDPDSANSQFFFMRAAYPSLEKRYTAFGRVISGQDVVTAIKVGEPVADPDKMTKVQLLADIPVPQRPRIFVLDPHSAAFKARVDALRAARGADFSVCDVELPVEIRQPGK